MSALTDLKAIAIYVLAALVLVLGLTCWQYKRMYKATDLALGIQNTAILKQNLAAAALLKTRTEERDAKQAELNKRATAQGKTDEQAVDKIAADDKLQRAAPVRVSVHNCARDAGRSGGRPAGEAAAPAGARAEDTGSASGVLSQAAAGRLADAIKEIEANSAAYASCRATLIPEPG